MNFVRRVAETPGPRDQIVVELDEFIRQHDVAKDWPDGARAYATALRHLAPRYRRPKPPAQKLRECKIRWNRFRGFMYAYDRDPAWLPRRK
jgi:hypothetical protein